MIAIWAGVALTSVFLLRGGCALSEQQYRKGFVPAKIATGLFYVDGNCGDMIAYRGAYAFSLKRETIVALKSQGLRFFDGIDAPLNRPSRRYFSGTWKATPISPADEYGIAENLRCGMKRDWRWPPGLREALGRPGGFYQSTGTRALIVLPEPGYVVAVAYDR